MAGSSLGWWRCHQQPRRTTPISQHHHHHPPHPHPQQRMPIYSTTATTTHGLISSDSSAAMRGSGGGRSCQDCGNQAKKDCSHVRCRTCCKNRALPCPTHVRSTWVPASKRRQRHHHHQQRLIGSSGGGGGELSKRPRSELPTPIPTTQLAAGATNFPSELSSPAVFRCVRVGPVDEADGVDEYAYRSAVSIGGHVFKGILYDQGPAEAHAGSSSSSAAVTSAAGTATVGESSSTVAAAASAGLIDPSALYPTPLSAFVAGTQFFPHHHSRP